MFHGWDIDDIVNTPVKRRKKRTVKTTKPNITKHVKKVRRNNHRKSPQSKSLIKTYLSTSEAIRVLFQPTRICD